jgi:PIN domain nuclease of toxin-antitoxin system
MLILDTSALLYRTLFPKKLTDKASQTIEAADTLSISSISIWEIGLKAKKGKLDLPVSIDDYVKGLKKIGKIEIIPVDVTIWLENIALDWDHQDPADRTIVAMAKLYDCPLVTSDREIRTFYYQAIW